MLRVGVMRRFLGTMVVFHWSYNSGSFAVKLTASCPSCAGECLAPPASAASLEIVSGDNQTGGTGRVWSSALAGQAVDDKGAPVAGIPVTFAVTCGSARRGATLVPIGRAGAAPGRLPMRDSAGAGVATH